MVSTALCMQAGINIAAAPFLSNEDKKLALSAPDEIIIFQRSKKKVLNGSDISLHKTDVKIPCGNPSSFWR